MRRSDENFETDFRRFRFRTCADGLDLETMYSGSRVFKIGLEIKHFLIFLLIV